LSHSSIWWLWQPITPISVVQRGSRFVAVVCVALLDYHPCVSDLGQKFLGQFIGFMVRLERLSMMSLSSV